MGKGDRRGKGKLPKPLPALEAIPKRRACGRHVEYDKGAKDPKRVVLAARCRQFGIKDTPENRAMLDGTHMSAQLGYVVQYECQGQRGGVKRMADLWGVWQGYCAAMRTYRARFLGNTGTPQSAAIAMLPDDMQTDQGHTIDTRDADQRDRDAVSAYMRWKGHVGHLAAAHRIAIDAAERDSGPALWREGATPAGRTALAALVVLHGVVNGQPDKRRM